MYKDNIFRLLVYSISTYLILIDKSIAINICGLIIIIAHIYKDIKKFDKWPIWCDFFGIIIAIILIIEGIKINNYFISFIGILKFLAHTRQYLLRDNRYYY